MPPKRKLKPRSPRLGSLGAAIKQARKKAGLSQEDLAAASGIHPTHVSRLERGTRDPAFSTLARIADGLDMSLSELTALADELYAGARRKGSRG